MTVLESRASTSSLGALLEALHYFDPCELLEANARSELRPEHRRRAKGGGWEPR